MAASDRAPSGHSRTTRPPEERAQAPEGRVTPPSAERPRRCALRWAVMAMTWRFVRAGEYEMFGRGAKQPSPRAAALFSSALWPMMADGR
eukprot:2210067-Prymnesium_polylepis.2